MCFTAKSPSLVRHRGDAATAEPNRADAAIFLSQSSDSPMTVGQARADNGPASRVSAFDPDAHAGFETFCGAGGVEAQPQRVAVVIADHALGLPGGEHAERPQLGDEGLGRAAAGIAVDVHGASDRKTVEMVLAHVEREPLPAGRRDRHDRLTRTHVLAQFRSDHADHA
ncbi:hypothetical protein chiPu_0028186, partial [Chiloscyllium punctatum]|nr:hypothetical protein [Chiloscyllium punctatum]